ncbi:MAG TPA: hypothetical protein VGK64_14410 [Bryobacteraceae bacterium]
MNCAEAELYVSSLYDGQQVPPSAAQHIAACESCRRVLQDYSHMGVELRLAATMAPEQLPPLKLFPQKHPFNVLWRRVSIPRFALAAVLAGLVLATTAVSILRAQSKPLWFQFGYGFHESDEVSHYTVAKKGYDDTQATLSFVNGAPVAVALRVKVESLSDDEAVLRCRAVPAKTETTSTGLKRLGSPEGGVSLDHVPAVHYKPGESLAISIEGGGTLYLKGDVLDHQPSIAFGFPLEPAPGKLIVRSPVLTGSDQLLGEINGATAVASDETRGVNFQTGSNGSFTFALRPFPGAVQGKLTCGEVTFKLAGKNFRLVAAAPITGGDQPRFVWVRRDPQPTATVALGTIPIQSLAR